MRCTVPAHVGPRGRYTAHTFPDWSSPLLKERSVLLGPVVHPVVNVPPEKAPVLPDFGSRELTQAGEFVHRGLWYAQKPRDLHHGQNLAFRRRSTVDINLRCRCDGIVHDG